MFIENLGRPNKNDNLTVVNINGVYYGVRVDKSCAETMAQVYLKNNVPTQDMTVTGFNHIVKEFLK